jgi:multicomponent Na+:H+ antiporter subunit B
MITLIDIVLLTMMAATAIMIARLTSLFAIVMLSGIYSFLAATVFVLLDAVDVAFTEAAVGAGVSTVLMLGTLAITREREESQPRHQALVPLVVVVLTAAALLYGVGDMPKFGDPAAPANKHVAPHYLKKSEAEIGIPNVVTSVLASYRGYDTLGETGVIFTAAVAVMALLGGGYRRRRRRQGRPDHLPGHEYARLGQTKVGSGKAGPAGAAIEESPEAGA